MGNGGTPAKAVAHQDLLEKGLDREDDRSQLSEEEQGQLLSQEVEAATAATAGDAQRADIAREKGLLSKMERVADQARGLPDARVRYLLDWIRRRMCPGVALPGHLVSVGYASTVARSTRQRSATSGQALPPWLSVSSTFQRGPKASAS
jgi:hypothetical protein